MQRTFVRMILALCCAAVLALLAGCGGDDAYSISAEDQARIDSAEAAATAARAAQAAAEADAAEAEADTAAETAARMEAEAAAAAANAAKMTAEAAQAAAEADAMTAKAAQAEAEAAQMTAEAAAKAAMAAQEEAEADASRAQAAQMAAEAARTAAVAAEAVAKAAQATAEADKADAEAAAMAAMEAQEKAEAALKDAETEATSDAQTAATALAAAVAAKELAESQAADAKEAEMEAMAAQEKAEMARDAAMKAQMDAETKAEMYKQAAADAEEAKKMAEADRDKYKMMAEEATADRVDTVGTTVGAAARAVAMRIEDSVTARVTARAADPDAQISARMARMPQIRKVGLADLARDDDGLSFVVKEGSTPRLTQADMDDDMAPSLTGWRDAALAKTGGGVMQEGVVYTDIDRSVTAFSARYPYTAYIGTDGVVADPPSGMSNSHVAAATAAVADVDNTVADERVVYFGATSPVSIEHGLSSSLSVRSLPLGTGLRGKYHGVPGQYVCGGTAGDTCKLTYDGSSATAGPRLKLESRLADDSAIGGAAVTLYFRADDPSTLLPDPDYLAFGAWMLSPSTATATGGFIRPFVDAGASTFTTNEMHALKGSADYTGAATGYYATRDAGSADANAGRFTATATLSADFDTSSTSGTATALDRLGRAQSSFVASGANVPYPTTHYRSSPGSPGTIKGQIDNFMAEDGTMMEGWVVNLGAAAIRPSSVSSVPLVSGDTDGSTTGSRALTRAQMATMLEGATTGTGHLMEWMGVWDATFHGNTKTTAPTGVIGTFQADAGRATPLHNDEGAIDLFDDPGFAGVVGSFGAKKQ